MMDVVLAGAMGFVLAVVLSSPPRPKVKAVTAKVVEETVVPDPKAAKGTKARKK